MSIKQNATMEPHVLLAAYLREQIERGEIRSRLPSITMLTEQTGFTVGTVRRALQGLLREGVIQSVPGRELLVIR
jgi:DNA-binding GntR family transcriptional regulator